MAATPFSPAFSSACVSIAHFQFAFCLFQSESYCKAIYMEISFIHTQMNQNLRVNKTNFHRKGFALGLALKQRWKATQKWAIETGYNEEELNRILFWQFSLRVKWNQNEKRQEAKWMKIESMSILFSIIKFPKLLLLLLLISILLSANIVLCPMMLCAFSCKVLWFDCNSLTRV